MKKIIGMVAVVGMVFLFSQASQVYARGGQGGGMGSGMGGGGTMTGGGNMTGGTGSNDRLRDADGDGVVNHSDTDYVRPQDGTGSGRGAVLGTGTGTPVLDGTGPHGAGKPTR
ncbi:MAG: hypothetical protein LAC69_01475 [Chlorobium sp.]|jgi:hypothetical protein|nr:hypothetical protein [Chlorobium sp.]